MHKNKVKSQNIFAKACLNFIKVLQSDTVCRPYLLILYYRFDVSKTGDFRSKSEQILFRNYLKLQSTSSVAFPLCFRHYLGSFFFTKQQQSSSSFKSCFVLPALAVTSSVDWSVTHQSHQSPDWLHLIM